MNSDDYNSLFDSHGNPIQKPKSDREALEALIRSELANAKEKLRESNTEKLNEIAETYYKPKITFLHKSNAYTLAVLAALLLFGWLAVPGIIRTKTENYIRENLVGAALTNTVNNVISEKADYLIENRLQPLKSNIDSLESKIETLSLDISNKQAQLASEQTTIRQQIHPLFGEIDSLQSSVEAAKREEKQLRDEQKLMALLNRGQLFDRDAIRQLELIAQGTNEIAQLAQAAFDNVQRSLILDRSALTWTTILEAQGTNQYGGPFTPDEIMLNLKHSSSSTLGSIVNGIGNQPLFVPILVKLAHQSKDLWTINRIAKKLNDIAGVNFYPWDLQPLDHWWSQNSVNYTNWPFQDFQKGVGDLSACHYQEALTNFENVLSVDPTADESRALAIACAVENGETLEAQKFNTNFAIRDGRWQQWAQAKLMLVTNQEKGTEMLVSIASKFPTFPQRSWIAPGNNIFRQIDWNLYEKSMQPANSSVPTNKISKASP